MSSVDYSDTSAALVDDFIDFFRTYYDNEVKELAQKYPNEKRYLNVEWSDLYQFHPDLADDLLTDPVKLTRYAEEALRLYDLPIDVTLSNVDVRFVGLNDGELYSPLELTRESPEGYVGVSGQLSKVTTPVDILEEAAYECKLCGTLNRIPQAGDDEQQPHECQGCQRQGPFRVNFDQSEFEPYCKIRVETPPDESGELQNEFIDGFVQGSLVWYGHEDYGLVARSGEPVTVYGQIELRQKEGRGVNGRLFDTYFDVHAIEFEGDDDSIDIPAYKDEFTALANSDDPVKMWKESLVPELYATPEWDTALELLITYLFGSPRIDIRNGPTIRGDIHVLIISDYGMGKSMVNNAVAMFSPKVIKESVTGMSSDVGLLAAAVEDDFGEGQWTLQPGILVRGNGGHVILDEIDKTDANLEKMNDALEGQQVVDINKAGQSATYKSRVGLLAAGNPDNSRFDQHAPISEQLNIDQSFLSRFDGIVTMQDDPEEEQDGYVAETAGKSYVEAFEYEYGDRETLDQLERQIQPDVGMNWIAYAREEVFPMPKLEHIEQIKDWYANDVRQLNKKFRENKEEGADMPVPVNARAIQATIRRAVAFARVHLRDEVTDEDVERAIALSKKLIGQQFDGEKFVPEEARGSSQRDRIQSIEDLIDDVASEHDEGAPAKIVKSRADSELGIDASKTEHEIQKLKNKGKVYEPSTNNLRTT